jgi:hypothetical protein
MFSTVKVRRNLARDDYRDPGWYRAPAGTVAREWQGEMPETRRAAPSGPAAPATLEVIKPGGHQGHH